MPRELSPAVEIDRLTRRYGDFVAADAVTLSVGRGEVFGFLGPNGAGKTTTIEILEGILEPTSGDVEVLGRRWGEDDQKLRESIGISLQETRLSEKLTVLETLRLFRSFFPRGLDPGAALGLVALEEKANARVGKLSGGQRQRLEVACALVGDPELLFLDEPSTGLDPQSRRQVWDILRDLRARGRTVLLTTHYMDEAERLCDRVAVVDHGKVIALGSPRELIASLAGEHFIDLSFEEENGATGQAAGSGSGSGSGTGGADRVPPESELASLPGVTAVRREGSRATLTVSEPHVSLPALFERLRGGPRSLSRLSVRHGSLEDVFVSLTGRHLRDGEGAA